MRLGLLVALVSLGVGARALEGRAERGRRIYREGVGRSEIQAVIGGTATLPGTALRCGGCHGSDGRGRREGGIDAPDITWATLTKPSGHVHEDGRRHGRFDLRTLSRSVTLGLDSAGNRLENTMPRYSITPDDLGALVAYLRLLGTEPEPGVTAETIRIGTVLPLEGPTAALGRALKTVLDAQLAALNDTGGIHGRRVELVVEAYDATRETGAAQARRLLAGDRVFALISGFAPRAEQELADLAARAGTPHVGPLSLRAAEGDTFLVASPLREQAEVLATFASRLPPDGRRAIAILHSTDDTFAEAARAAQTRLGELGLPSREATSPTDSIALAASTVLLVTSDAQAHTFLAALAGSSSPPHVLVPGALAGDAVFHAPPALEGRLHVTWPFVPSRPAALALALFAGRSELRGQASSALSAALAVAVLTEGLRRSGRALTRTALVASLEGMRGFDPGYGPLISFGRERRSGIGGAFVVPVGLARPGFGAPSEWIAAPP